MNCALHSLTLQRDFEHWNRRPKAVNLRHGACNIRTETELLLPLVWFAWPVETKPSCDLRYTIRGAVAAIAIVVPAAVAVASSQSHHIIKASPTPMPTAASLQLLVSDYRRVYHIHRRPSHLSSTHQRIIQWWPDPASAAPSPAMSIARAAWVLKW